MDLDVTLFIQLGIFCVVLAVLNGLLLKPILKVIETRHQRMFGVRDEVQRLDRLRAQEQAVYEARITDARRKAQREREELRTAARAEERRLLGEVRAEITKQVGLARKEITSAEQEASTALLRESDAIAEQIIGKLLGRRSA